LYLRFKKSDTRVFFKRIGILAAVSLTLAIIIGILQEISGIQYWLLLIASVFAVCANIYYAASLQKKLLKMGAAISHLGFGMILLGVLISSYNKEVISYNTLGLVMDFGKTQEENIKESRENSILYRGIPVAMQDFFVTYQGDSTSASDPRTFYKILFERFDSLAQKPKETFVLYPDAFVNPKGQEGLIA